MKPPEIARLTPYDDVKRYPRPARGRPANILHNQLVGLYLTGSLTYGDFERGSSDIDFLAVLSREISVDQRIRLKKLHGQIATNHPLWADRIEGSYITTKMLAHIEPPAKPRPYVNGGKMWDPDPLYGNEWLINLYALRDCGVALLGPNPKSLIGPVDITLVREASLADLHQEWAPLLQTPSILDSHHQAYITLTLCRILHRAKHDNVVSKRVASTWAKQTYGQPWSKLIEKAENWHHGQELGSVKQVQDFIRFTIAQVG